MTHVIANEPILDFFQDVFETPELSINILFVDVQCGATRHPTRPTVKHNPVATNPPVKAGKVTPVRISGHNKNWRRK